MRRSDQSATLTAAQLTAAGSGFKCLVPDSRGRPFLDHILESLFAAGIEEVILVVGPDHTAFTEYLSDRKNSLPATSLAVQEEPLGTANALLAAAEQLGERPFLVMNSDNLYPVDAIRQLASVDGCGLVAFNRSGLVASGMIPAERVTAFAILSIDASGRLTGLIEKPNPKAVADAGKVLWVSMNLWRGDTRLLTACRNVTVSQRGEFELPEAVMQAVEDGTAFPAVLSDGEVMDLSHQSDIEQVAIELGERALSQ
jgi:dTDP-glucose pyrophosphorylase